MDLDSEPMTLVCLQQRANNVDYTASLVRCALEGLKKIAPKAMEQLVENCIVLQDQAEIAHMNYKDGAVMYFKQTAQNAVETRAEQEENCCELQAQVTKLQAQVTKLQAQVAALQAREMTDVGNPLQPTPAPRLETEMDTDV